MTAAATGAAEKDPPQIRSMACGGSAGRGPVGRHVILMQDDIGIPGHGVFGIQTAYMACGTGRSAALDAGKVRSVTGGVGTTRIPIQKDIPSMQGIGKISP